MHIKSQGIVIRGRDTRVVLVGAIVAHSSEAVGIKVGTLCIILIKIRVSLVASIMLHFRLLMKLGSPKVIVLLMVVFSLEVFNIGVSIHGGYSR